MKRIIENVVFGVISIGALIGAGYLICYFAEFMFRILGCE